MKKSKFSEAQIAFILRQADEGTPVAEVADAEGLAWPRSAHRTCFAANSLQLRADRRQPRVDPVEHELVLFLAQRIDAQFLQALAVAGALEHGDDQHQPCNAFVGIPVQRCEFGVLGTDADILRLDRGIAIFKPAGLLRHGDDQRLQRLNIVGKVWSSGHHRR